MAIWDWSSTAGSNTSIDTINIAEGCSPGNVNNALRAIMANVRAAFSSGLQSFLNGSTALPIENGGTGATTIAAARGALSAAKSGANSDITSLSGLTTALSIAQGGTGAVTADAARSALGAQAAISFGSNGNGYWLGINTGSQIVYVLWGTRPSGNNGASSTYTFPITDMTAVYGIQVTPTTGNPSAVDGNVVWASATSNSTFVIGSDDGNRDCFWTAIGSKGV